jgi:hypothetical protein
MKAQARLDWLVRGENPSPYDFGSRLTSICPEPGSSASAAVLTKSSVYDSGD